ncbi:MAG TPA: DNA polymerase III subunit beta, partial [Kineosporiaceae bacterium]|nr:DNA polymerase III subunit beta [Kineosporiaceae bacterium]
MSAQPVATPPPTPSHAPGVNLAMPADSLLKALRRLEPTTCNRPPTPILTCILVDTTGGTVTLHGTNYETHARTTLADVELTDTTDRRVVIPRGPLTTVVRALRQVCAAKNPLVTLDGVTHPGWVTVSAEGYERPLQTFSIDEWPNIPTMVDPCPTGAPVVTAVGADLASALRFPMVAVSQDETLPILGGIHIRHDDGRLRFTATDRYRLADVTLPVEATGPIGA